MTFSKFRTKTHYEGKRTHNFKFARKRRHHITLRTSILWFNAFINNGVHPFGAFLFIASAVAIQRLATQRIVSLMWGAHSRPWRKGGGGLKPRKRDEEEYVGVRTFLCVHDSEVQIGK